MHFNTALLSTSALLGLAAAAPYNPFPLSDGFPNPNATELKQIGVAAGGTLPNGPLPTSLTPSGTVTLQLIALNEIFEVAFYTDLLKNITDCVSGYELTNYNRTFVIETITAIQNQEKLHYLGANGILASANQTQIKPCSYKFPVASFESAIALANTFTDVVLGVLPMAQTTFATDGGQEIGLVNLLGSIIGQEAQQDGWFRSVQGKVPSAAPFLTTEGPAFAFTFLQSVIVPGSCPNINLISDNVPTFGALNVLSMPPAANSTVYYSVNGTVTSSANSLVYISGQNLPVTVAISNVGSKNGLTTFQAPLPFDTGFAKGLTIAAVVKGSGQSFANVSAVATATVFGPGIIEID